ncbi:MAG: histidine--tRNA ligase [Oscillospiraceae bacterium]|nr:histidine--tRNA ligase [Oscillospiraceae bacterium]MBO7373485.1 histidine--tRNA ligase [Oscillospiraceae bacterium]
MNRVKPRTLSGFMELLPEDQMKMERMMQILRETYALFAFTPLDTPIIEAAEVLLAKGGGETEKQIYRFEKGDSDLALRFDLTVPLAKYVAAHYAELAFPFRRYQIGKVYRGERAQRGRFREFYQADIDVIGDGKLDIANEAEIPAIIYTAFSRLGLKRFKIKVNNRKLLNGFYAMNGMAEKSQDIMRTVDKLDKVGEVKVKQMLVDELSMIPSKAENVLDFMAICGSNAEILERLECYRGMDETFDRGLNELRAVTEHLSAFGVPEENFSVDLTIARGLDYYTGTVYETELTDYPEIGSVCSGGRYDNLAEYYTDRQLPGVGISIGLTRLFYVLQEQKLLSDELMTAPCDVLVIPMTENRAPAIAAATALRASGLRCQLYAEQRKFKAKMSYADKIGTPFTVLLGEDELAEGVLTVKNMETGEQRKLTDEEAAAWIWETVKRKNAAAPIRG